jgi:predicted mannosyl-3-phosphoglycerate phosphatase (HAD superfamily)
MIDFTIVDEITGEILRIGSCSRADIDSQAGNGENIEIGHYSADDFYFVNGIATQKGSVPDDDSEWDIELKKWKFNKAEAKRKLKKKVESARERRDTLDISYDGKNIQADSESRANIHGKLAEIAAAQAFGQTTSPLIWRDSDNIDHAWTDMLIYKAWLQGLVMAIAARSTALYQASWAHKAAIAALEAVQEIKNYDINTGW